MGKKTVKLDVKDKKILYQLDMNARQSNSHIGRAVGLSHDSVNYRIKRMEKENIITGYYSIINFSKIGYLYCRLFLKLSKATKEIQDEIFNSISNQKQVIWLSQNHGRWDLAIVFLVENINELNNIYKKFVFGFNKYIENKELSIASKFYNYKNKFLIVDNNTDFLFSVSGEDKKIFDLTQIDRVILKVLSRNARVSLISLCKVINSNLKTTRNRLNFLEKMNIIQEYRVGINYKKLGIYHYHVFLFLENMSQKKENDLILYLRNNSYVTYTTLAIGRSDLEFDILLPGDFQLGEFMDELRVEFTSVFKKYEFIMIYKLLDMGYFHN